MATKPDKKSTVQEPFMLRGQSEEAERKLAHSAAWTPAFFPERRDGWARRPKG